MSNNLCMLNCYHGTSVEAYGKIKAKTFTHEKRDDHWLGQGVYYFLDDLIMAKWFATQCKLVKYKKQIPCVLYSKIFVDHEKLLNMNTSRGFDKFNEVYKEMTTIILANTINVEKDDSNKIICLVYDHIKNVDVIMKVYDNSAKSPQRLEECSNYVSPSHTQVCVREIKCIKETNIVYRG